MLTFLDMIAERADSGQAVDLGVRHPRWAKSALDSIAESAGEGQVPESAPGAFRIDVIQFAGVVDDCGRQHVAPAVLTPELRTRPNADLVSADLLERAEDLMLVNSGSVCEQFAGQHLLHSGEFFAEPELYCWMREKSQSSAEVDYLISVGGVVVPVEVKAGKTGTLKSLHVFLREKQRDFGLRLNTDLPSLLEAETSVAGGGNRPFRLLSLPLYLVEQASRLCRDCLQA